MRRLIPDEIETPRLRLRRPRQKDAAAIFDRYASVPDVTRYLSWPTHRSVGDTRAFIDASERAWADQGAGPLLVLTKDGALLGGTGLALEEPHRAGTGYVFAKDAWGHGFATEVTQVLASLAFQIPSLSRLEATCHVENAPSARVLEKAGFLRETLLLDAVVFPNSGTTKPAHAWRYARLRTAAALPR